MFSEDMDRRKAIKVIVGGSAVAAAMIAGYAIAGDSGGSGSSGGTWGGGSVWGGEYLENSLIWYDRGGFVDNHNYDINQIKYGEESVQLFWGMVKDEVKRVSGLDPRSPYESQSWEDTIANEFGVYPNTAAMEELFTLTMRRAISEAENLARAKGDNEAQARIVAIGWVWGDFGDGWQCATDLLDSSRQTYDGIIYRKSNDAECPGAYGWDDPVSETWVGHEGETWRDFIYNLGRDQNPNLYSLIALAVCDSDLPGKKGYMTLEKSLGF